MQDFIKMSKYAGMREDLIQAGGGNSSYKISSNKMAIKASGVQLSDITEKEGFALVNPEVIRDYFIKNDAIETITEEDGNHILQKAHLQGGRPSIETFLHAISDKYTLHTHPIVVNALACRKGGMEILKQLFPKSLLVSYATPGVELAIEYFRSYREVSNTAHNVDIVFLQNHGLVVSGKTADEVIEKTEYVTNTIEKYLSCNMTAYHDLTLLWKWFSNKLIWKVTDSHILHAYHELGHMWKHTFCPDCVVFLGKRVLKLPAIIDKEYIDAFYSSYGYPVILEYKDHLYLLADTLKKAMEIQSVLSFSAQVMMLNKNFECNLLSEQEQNFLLNWDAEKYRKNIK